MATEKTIELGDGKVYRLAQLAWGPLKRLLAVCDSAAHNGEQKGDAIAQALHASLKRWHPDVTFERVEEELLTDLGVVLAKLMEVSGMAKPTPGEPASAPAGEPQRTPSENGMPSTST